MRLCTLHTTTISAHVAEKFKEVGSDLTRHKDTKEAALIKVWTAVESNYYFWRLEVDASHVKIRIAYPDWDPESYGCC